MNKQPFLGRKEQLQQLVPGLLARERDAEFQFYELYSAFLFSFIKGEFVNNGGLVEQDAEDVVSETMLKFLDIIREFSKAGENMADPLNYLYTIAANKCKACLRKKGQRPPVSSLEQHKEASGWEPVVELSIEDLEGARSEKFDDIIQGLTEKQKAVLRLRYQEDMEIKGIAERLKVTVRTVSSYLKNAIEFLKGKLEDKQAGAGQNRSDRPCS